MNREEIRQQLFAMQDTDYREFQVKLIPTVDPEKVIGVRTPQLRKFAKELFRDPDAESFLEDLPHECVIQSAESLQSLQVPLTTCLPFIH